MVSESQSTQIENQEALTGAGPWLISLAGWLVPGLGHLLLRRWGRAAIMFAGIMAMFFFGLLMGGHLFTVSGPDQQATSLLLRVPPVIANFGTGLPYLICYVLDLGFTSRAILPTSEYGNTFLWVAGLLNYLASLDAFDIAVGRKP
jgi:hypothetical protein